MTALTRSARWWAGLAAVGLCSAGCTLPAAPPAGDSGGAGKAGQAGTGPPGGSNAGSPGGTAAGLAPTGGEAEPEPAVPPKGRPTEKERQEWALPDPERSHAPGAGRVEPTKIGRTPAPGPAPEGMVWIPPGRFSMGSDYTPFDDARPIHPVELDGFWMDRTPVTNAHYAKFVQATRYVTVAERRPKPEELPGVPPEDLVAGAVVFAPPKQEVPLDDHRQWWAYVAGASWKHPEGPASSIRGREQHPVVHVAYEDVEAYAQWAGKRLPTEAEWEYAARGKLTQKPYVWGNQFQPGGKLMANTFQGTFPNHNLQLDGFARTSPVAQFPANGFGLRDVAGNVWQWCSDWYRADTYARSVVKNPQGPPDSHDPDEPGVPKRVQRGGSFLCSSQYCSRYMPGGRGKGAVDTGSSHVGFRCARSARPAAPRGG